VSVKELEFSDLTAIERDVEMTYALEVPRYALDEDGALTFSPFGKSRSYVETYAPLSARKHDLVIPYPWTTRSTFRYRLPGGYTAPQLPQPLEVMSPFGSFALKYRLEGDQLAVDSEITLAVSRVAANEYAAFRAFLGQIDQAVGRRVKLARGVPIAPSAGAQ